MLKNMRDRYIQMTAKLGVAWAKHVVSGKEGRGKQEVLAYLDSGRYEKLLGDTMQDCYLFTGWVPWRLVHNIKVGLAAKELVLNDLQDYRNQP